MFAFAIWDVPRRRLLLARDRLGVKPLYWCCSGNRLLFGSEIKAILASGLVRPEPNDPVIPEVLTTRYTSDDQTLFKGIHRLLPGQLLVYEAGRVRVRRYWDIPTGAPATEETFDTLTRKFRELLEESIRLRLMSDVPLGMFLSGGIDSSAVAALMARMIDRPLQTFSVAFKDRAFSELEYSRAVATAVRAETHEVVIDERDFFGALPRLVWHEDEPIAHPSSVPLYFVSRLARDHVKVVLTGEGSDELLAGYGKYPRSLLNWRAGSVYSALTPERVRTWVRERLAPRIDGRLGRYVQRSFAAMPHTPEAAFFDNFAGIRLQHARQLLTDDTLRAARDPYAASLAWLERAHSGTPLLNRVLYADLKTYLVELLMKQDQMSMAASVESRVPFLDHKLVEFAAMLPPSAKLRGFTTKRLLRAAVKDVLPPEILTRRKMGFPVPFGRWMRTQWSSVASEVLLDRRARERGVYRPAVVERLIESHRAGITESGDALWALVNLELWYRTFIDGEGVQVLHTPAGDALPESGAPAPTPHAPPAHEAAQTAAGGSRRTA
jgi:asparagine synthase (glutamine-hydrolysing)